MQTPLLKSPTNPPQIVSPSPPPTSNKIQRTSVNKFWVFLPILSLILIIPFSIYTIIRSSVLDDSNFPGSHLIFYTTLIAIALISLIIFPLYLSFLYYLKNAIKTLFIAFPLISILAIILAGILYFDFIVVIIGLVALILISLFFYCLWSQIEIAIISIKTALAQLFSIKSKLTKQFIIFQFLGIVIISFYAVSVLNVILIAGIGSKFGESLVGEKETIFLRVLVSINSFFVVYLMELLAAISTIYGAAFFDQFTILKKEAKVDFIEICNNASLVAFKFSIGTACLGALLLTFISIFISESRDRVTDNGGSIGGLILYCLISILGEIINFLTIQAYVYSALYGRGLFESGKLGFESFKRAGIERFINFKLSSQILNTMSFFFSFFVGLLAVMMVIVFYNGEIIPNMGLSNEMEIAILTLYMLFIILNLAIPFLNLNSVIFGHSNAQIAVYVEDPERFKNSHPKADKFIKLLEC